MKNGFLKANISKKDGKTVVSYRIGAANGKDDNGNYLYEFRTVKTDSISEAKRALRELQSEIDKGNYIRPDKQTVKEFLGTWLKDIAFNNMTPRTYESYQFSIEKYIIPTIGNIPLTKLKPQNIQHFLGNIQSNGHHRTAEYAYNTLNKCLNIAVKQNLIIRNPCQSVEKPKVPQHEMKTMSEIDIHILLEYARGTDYYDLFYLALFTGMRRSELLALRWKDIDLENKQISVNRTLHFMRYGDYKGQVIFKQPKTVKSRRPVAISPSTIKMLTEHKEKQAKDRKSLELPEIKDDDLIFCSYNGEPLQPDSISHAFMKLARRTGLKGIRLHDTRHTFASIHLKNGTHPKIVQEMLGHTSIETTLNTYSHVAPGLQQDAAKQFDRILAGRI